MPRLLPLRAFAALLAACAGPPDAVWVMRPEGGAPTLIEQITHEYERDPIGTAHIVGQFIGQIALIVLRLARGP